MQRAAPHCAFTLPDAPGLILMAGAYPPLSIIAEVEWYNIGGGASLSETMWNMRGCLSGCLVHAAVAAVAAVVVAHLVTRVL